MTTITPDAWVSPGGAGALLALLRDGRPRTRAELAALTGMSRSTVAQRIDALLAARLVGPAGDAVSTGGRPPSRFAFNPGSRLVLAADLGATHARVAVTDLAGTVLTSAREDLDIADGPQRVLDRVGEVGTVLLREVQGDERALAGVGIGLPGPVEHATGRPVRPPIMPGWDGYDVRRHVRERVGDVPVVVDNDVNVMALGEHFRAWPDEDHLVFVKVSTGIGSGIISDGQLRRGAQGAAGDLGHIQVPHAVDVLCRCGNRGCLEALAGGAALVERLSAAGLAVRTGTDVAAAARGGSLEAVQALRDAGRHIGEVLAHVVSLLNPSVVVVGGSLASAGEHLLAGVREVVYSRSLPLATQHLRIVPSSVGEDAGVVGAAVLVVDQVLAPAEVDRTLG